jgi:hypothetical protein
MSFTLFRNVLARRLLRLVTLLISVHAWDLVQEPVEVPLVLQTQSSQSLYPSSPLSKSTALRLPSRPSSPAGRSATPSDAGNASDDSQLTKIKGKSKSNRAGELETDNLCNHILMLLYFRRGGIQLETKTCMF